MILIYKKYTENVSLFHEKLETLNAKGEVDIILGVFHLNAQNQQMFQHISIVLSNFHFLFHNCTHLNGA